MSITHRTYRVQPATRNVEETPMSRSGNLIAYIRQLALRHPLRLSAPPPPLNIMMLPAPSGRCLWALLTVDLDWIEGPAWHLLLSDKPLVPSIPSCTEMDPFDPESDPDITHLLEFVVGDVGQEAGDCYRSKDGVTYHAFCLLTEAELTEVGRAAS